jgi:C4-dicarboxylate-specific signal transduction histidine kinase
MPDDITNELRVKLAAATEALRKAEARALAGQFAIEIMHEVRNPLEALGYLLHLAAQEDDLETIRAYLRQANEQIATVSEIAAQTLGFVKNAPRPHQVDLTALVEAALRIHHRRIATQKIHLVRDFEDDVTAEIYSGAILQVLSNLLANASMRYRRKERFHCAFGNLARASRCSSLITAAGWSTPKWHGSSSLISRPKKIAARGSVSLYRRRS